MNAVAGTERAGFSAVAHLDDLTINVPHAVVVADREICLLRTEDDLIAFDDRCPHRGHPLSAARCEGGVLRCALHGWEFSLPEGKAVSPRAPFGLELLDLRIVEGRVEVRV
jgi:phenylpropionate dioxygenase-like ring-hydroxylating dioxygenase large terminal subunit